jgi:lipoic acid synthetase
MDLFKRKKLPTWIKSPLPSGKNYAKVRSILQQFHLHTICSSGHCPNKGECWNRGTASFMIMGNQCTRNCQFCNVKHGKPKPLDWKEPERLATTIRLLQLQHVVITSVNRDDISDNGASFWAETIQKVKALNTAISIEALIPDFNGNQQWIQTVIHTQPEVISHNLETIKRITPQVRSHANYDQSLGLISSVSKAGIIAKSGIMLGMGERYAEVLQCMDDLRQAGCKILTLGQYLQPNPQSVKVKEYIHLDQFELYRQEGLKRGFAYVEAGPLVRSSYHAEKHVKA